MNESDIASAIRTIVGLLLLAWLLYGPWQTLVADAIRQKLFELRDHLFDLAASGEFSFSDEAYLHARSRLNANIRFAHKATIWRVAVLRPFIVRHPPATPHLPHSDARGYPRIKWVLRRSELLVVLGMWLRSPLLMVCSAVLAVPIALAFLLSDAFGRLSKRVYSEIRSAAIREALADKPSRKRVASATI